MGLKVYGGQEIEANSIILATGSDSIPLPFIPFDEKVVVSSTGALSLPKVPKKMVVVGAGVIGLELASVYSRLGTEVAIIEMMDCVCPGMDGAISRGLQQVLTKQGMEFYLSTKVEKATVKGGKVSVVAKGEKEHKFSADVMLIAIGRRPYSEGLGLENVGVTLTRQGLVPVDGNFRTVAHPHIYAIGDLIEGPMLAHKASEEGIAVAEIIAGKKSHVNYMGIPNVVYTHPEVASVGFTEEEAKERGLSIKTGVCAFKGNARARCSGDTDGFVKVIGEASTGKLIGVHILGSHASEMIGEAVIAIEKKATLEEVARASHAHPTLSEAIKEACMQALGTAIHL